jgi:3',5'-nucleoside bisphosphate phosphatase
VSLPAPAHRSPLWRTGAGRTGLRRAGLVDLHVHSNISDGRLSPAELVRQAAKIGLRVLSLTDHDAVDGTAPAMAAAAAFPGLLMIPGVEISTDLPEGEAHVLGYYIDYTSPILREALERFRTSRQTRARRMIEKLAGLGVAIDWGRVQEIAGDGTIGRPHIARAMLEKGYIKTLEEAFDKYLGHGGPAYVARDKMTPEEAIELVVSAGGLPVLAHPFTVGDPEAMVPRLKPAGLVGIEAYYKDNTPEQTQSTLRLAAKYGLIATGGSDYHGNDAGEVGLGGVEVPMEAVARLAALAAKKAGEAP